MVLKTVHNLATRTITEQEAWTFLRDSLDCFGRHGIDSVALVYGYNWGNEIYNWKDQIVAIAEVPSHIKNVESMKLGWLGYDDLYIRVGDLVQIQYCHHEHIHLNYNQDDPPLVAELVKYFRETIGLKE